MQTLAKRRLKNDSGEWSGRRVSPNRGEPLFDLSAHFSCHSSSLKIFYESLFYVVHNFVFIAIDSDFRRFPLKQTHYDIFRITPKGFSFCFRCSWSAAEVKEEKCSSRVTRVKFTVNSIIEKLEMPRFCEEMCISEQCIFIPACWKNFNENSTTLAKILQFARVPLDYA